MTNATDVAAGKPVSAPVPMPLGADGKPLTAGYIRYAMWMLLIIYIFNFLDRQIVNILAADIKSELKIGDFYFGLLSGTAFAFLYTFAGIPIARYAERKNRPIIMSVSLFVWSFFTLICGAAQNFAQFALARVGVGVGEAGGTPPAHSLISDYAPREKRASALAFYSMGVPIGTLAGLIFGGLIADHHDAWRATPAALAVTEGFMAWWATIPGWRVSFIAAGGPGIILAFLTYFTLKETRSKLAADVKARDDQRVPFTTVLNYLLMKKPTFKYLSLAAALKAFISYGTSAFLPLFYFNSHPEQLRAFAESFGMGDRTFLGIVIGIISGVFGAAGSVIGGWICDKVGAKDVKNVMVAPALAVLISVPIYIMALFVKDMTWSLIIVTVPYLLNYFWYGPVYGTTQSIVPPHMRATAAAILLFVINMIGLGIGPAMVGLISDNLANNTLAPQGLSIDICKAAGAQASAACKLATADSLKLSLAICSSAGLLSFALFMLARRTVSKDVES